MAHELTFQNGTAQMFSVRETPWHREGRILTAAPSYEEALRIAGHDFTVEVRPTFRRIDYEPVNGVTPEPDFIENREAKVTVRTDTGRELGAVGRGYRPIQNRDAFGVLVPLLDAGVASLETGGSLREGADVWMLVKFDLDKFGENARDVLGGEVVPFGMIANNHNGRRGCLLQLTPIRVVCANTLGAAEGHAGLIGDEGRSADGKAIVVRHTEAGTTKVVEAATELFAGIVARYEVIARQYALLKNRTLTEREFQHLVLDVVAPDPRDAKSWNPEARMAETVVARVEAKRALLTKLWVAGDGHTGDQSAWEAYNGVVQAIDHDVEGLWPSRSGVHRTASLLHGAYGDTKQRVLNKLVAFAA